MKIKNIYYPICHRRTYFTGKIVYESKSTKIIEWKCANCGVILKSKHDKLGKEYNRKRKREGLSLRPAIWIRKGNYRDLLYFDVRRRLYAFRYSNVERLERDEILAIPVYRVANEKI
jgi:hypothetical protein